MFAILTSACFRSEIAELTIHVPRMESKRDARIVTNAAMEEVVGYLDGIRHEVEIDLENHRILYHESDQLLDPHYQAKIIGCLSEVGFAAEIVQAEFNPLAPIKLYNNTILNSWPDRFSSMISIPEMDSVTEANIAVDAIAYARIGGDDPRVFTDLARKEIRTVYDSVALSEKNVEEAIACTGYAANSIPPQSTPQGWDRF